MLPTLGEERRATYSPFLPISPSTGRVLYVPMKAVDAKAGTITFEDEDGSEVTLPVTAGHVKLQWKPDFGMRWAALGVDFEMFGKDHQDNAPLYSKICKILGGNPKMKNSARIIRSGIFITARRPMKIRRSPLRSCSIWSVPPMRLIQMYSGVSSKNMHRLTLLKMR